MIRARTWLVTALILSPAALQAEPPRGQPAAVTAPATTRRPAPAAPSAPAAPPPVVGKWFTTRSGLRYLDEKVGAGAQPKRGQRVRVHYTGWLKNGKKFDSSLDRGDPFAFSLGLRQVIAGWDEGIATMRVGGKRKLVIPPALGYGGRDVGDGLIPPNSELTFSVELLGIE